MTKNNLFIILAITLVLCACDKKIEPIIPEQKTQIHNLTGFWKATYEGFATMQLNFVNDTLCYYTQDGRKACVNVPVKYSYAKFGENKGMIEDYSNWFEFKQWDRATNCCFEFVTWEDENHFHLSVWDDKDFLWTREQ